MDKKLLWTREVRHRIPALFGRPGFLGIYYTEQDLKYIEIKIKTDKLYRVFCGNAYDLERNSEATCNWLEQFLSDPDCPNGVRAFIINYTNFQRGYIKACDELDGTNRYAEYLQHLFLTELWIDKTREGR